MKKLFVAMPYGRRRAPLDSDKQSVVVEVDFDAVWEEILLPAVPAGFETKRADELRQSGLIDRLYNEWLFESDVVLADLTFGNPNVYYELGIRQALSKKGTVLVACKGTSLPFDVRNQYVILYDYFAAPTLRAFQKELGEAIEKTCGQQTDSPVHVFLPGLFVDRFAHGMSPQTRIEQLSQHIDELESDLRRRQSKDEEDRFVRKLREADSGSRVLGLYRLASSYATSSVDLCEQLAKRLRQFGYFDEALDVLRQALELKPKDPELLRELGFVYRKKGKLHYSDAEKFMREALELNETDVELHGILGGLLKRKEDYAGALRHYRRAYDLEPDSLYALVNLGAISAALGDVGEARQWYELVWGRCKGLIGRGGADYWTYICGGEAAVALNDEDSAIRIYREAIALKPPIEDLRSATEQLEFLLASRFAVETARAVLPTLRHELESQPEY